MLKGSIIGNLGNDPEMRYSVNGTPYLRFNVASNGRTRTPEGEWVDETTWVRVTVFGQRAESIGQYLRKGTKVYVDGKLEARPWIDQQDNVRAGLEILASEVQFMTPRDDGQDSGGYGRQEQRQPVSAGTQRQQQAPQRTQQDTRQQLELDDDDAFLPF